MGRSPHRLHGRRDVAPFAGLAVIAPAFASLGLLRGQNLDLPGCRLLLGAILLQLCRELRMCSL